jgi:hypothetical protein
MPPNVPFSLYDLGFNISVLLSPAFSFSRFPQYSTLMPCGQGYVALTTMQIVTGSLWLGEFQGGPQERGRDLFSVCKRVLDSAGEKNLRMSPTWNLRRFIRKPQKYTLKNRVWAWKRCGVLSLVRHTCVLGSIIEILIYLGFTDPLATQLFALTFTPESYLRFLLFLFLCWVS